MGLINGVISTQPGFIGKDEVVIVEFDPKIISYGELIKAGDKSQCANKVFTLTDPQQAIAKKIIKDRAMGTQEKMRPDKEPKYYLSKTLLRFVPMTRMQFTKINAQLKSKNHLDLLSPRQIKVLEAVKKNPKKPWPPVIDQDPTAAWRRIIELL